MIFDSNQCETVVPPSVSDLTKKLAGSTRRESRMTYHGIESKQHQFNLNAMDEVSRTTNTIFASQNYKNINILKGHRKGSVPMPYANKDAAKNAIQQKMSRDLQKSKQMASKFADLEKEIPKGNSLYDSQSRLNTSYTSAKQNRNFTLPDQVLQEDSRDGCENCQKKKLANYKAADHEFIRINKASVDLDNVEMATVNTSEAETAEELIASMSHLLKTYNSSLETVLIRAPEQYAAHYSVQLRAFIARVTEGLGSSIYRIQDAFKRQEESFVHRQTGNVTEVERLKVKLAKLQAVMAIKNKKNFLPNELESEIQDFFAINYENKEGYTDAQEVMRNTMSKSMYSETDDTLTQVQDVIEMAQKSTFEKMHLSTSDQNLLSQDTNEKLFKQLKEVLYMEDRDMVRTTGLKILQDYKRFFETKDNSSQTYDNFVDQMKESLRAKDTTIKNLREQMRDMERSNQALQIKISGAKMDLAHAKTELQDAKELEQSAKQELADARLEFAGSVYAIKYHTDRAKQFEDKHLQCMADIEALTHNVQDLQFNKEMLSDKIENLEFSIAGMSEAQLQVKKPVPEPQTQPRSQAQPVVLNRKNTPPRIIAQKPAQVEDVKLPKKKVMQRERPVSSDQSEQKQLSSRMNTQQIHDSGDDRYQQSPRPHGMAKLLKPIPKSPTIAIIPKEREVTPRTAKRLADAKSVHTSKFGKSNKLAGLMRNKMSGKVEVQLKKQNIDETELQAIRRATLARVEEADKKMNYQKMMQMESMGIGQKAEADKRLEEIRKLGGKVCDAKMHLSKANRDISDLKWILFNAWMNTGSVPYMPKITKRQKELLLESRAIVKLDDERLLEHMNRDSNGRVVCNHTHEKQVKVVYISEKREEKQVKVVQIGNTDEKQVKVLQIGGNSDEKQVKVVQVGNTDEKQVKVLQIGGNSDEKQVKVVQIDGNGDEKQVKVVQTDGNGDEKQVKVVQITGNGDEKQFKVVQIDGNGDEKQVKVVQIDGNGDKKQVKVVQISGNGDEKQFKVVQIDGNGDEKQVKVVQISGNGDQTQVEVVEIRNGFDELKESKGTEDLKVPQQQPQTSVNNKQKSEMIRKVEAYVPMMLAQFAPDQVLTPRSVSRIYSQEDARSMTYSDTTLLRTRTINTPNLTVAAKEPMMNPAVVYETSIDQGQQLLPFNPAIPRDAQIIRNEALSKRLFSEEQQVFHMRQQKEQMLQKSHKALIKQQIRADIAQADLLELEREEMETQAMLKKTEMIEKMNKYYNQVHASKHPSDALNNAKTLMDYTEFRLLTMMLQLRGQFGKEGALMVNSGIQVFEDELIPLTTTSDEFDEPTNIVITRTSFAREEQTSPIKPVVETCDASQYVTETMLNIIIDREKTYLKNAQRLYGMLHVAPADSYQKGHASGHKHNSGEDLNCWLKDNPTVRRVPEVPKIHHVPTTTPSVHDQSSPSQRRRLSLDYGRSSFNADISRSNSPQRMNITAKFTDK